MKQLLLFAAIFLSAAGAGAETTSTAHGGFYSAQISRGAPGGDSGLDKQDAVLGLDVVPGHNLTLSFYARNGQVAASTFERVALVFFTSGGAYINPPGDLNFHASSTVPTTWTQFLAGPVTVPATAAKMNVAFRLSPNSTVVLDDVSVIDTTVGPTAEIMVNGGFEDWPASETSAPAQWRFFVASATGSILRLGQIANADPAWRRME